MSNARARSSHEKRRRFSDSPSRNTAFFAAVIHVTEPPNRRNRGVVRTTSPVAPSLTIKTFILAQNISQLGSRELILFSFSSCHYLQAYLFAVGLAGLWIKCC